MDVVYDPNGVMAAYGTNDQFVLSDEDGVIVWKQKYANSSQYTPAIDAELAD